MRRQSRYARATSRPIGHRGRLILSGLFLLVAVVLGVAASGAVYRANRAAIGDSAAIGRLLCGSGQRVGDVPAGRRGIRLVCRDAAGREVGGPNNGVAALMALPFILLVAAPLLWLAWKADFRERKG